VACTDATAAVGAERVVEPDHASPSEAPLKNPRACMPSRTLACECWPSPPGPPREPRRTGADTLEP
jgi:hypothetical protein